MALSPEGARELRGTVVACIVGAPGFIEWLPMAARIGLPMLGIAFFAWTFCPKRIWGISMSFGMVLAAVSIVGLISGGILHFAAPGLLTSSANAEPAKPAMPGPTNNSSGKTAGGNITNVGPVYNAPVTINPDTSVSPPRKRVPKKEAQEQDGVAIGSLRDSTFAKQRGRNNTIIIEDSSACGFDKGLDQAGEGNVIKPGNLQISKDCRNGGAEFHIGHMVINPANPPAAPAAVPPDCHGLVDVSGSEGVNVTADFNTISGQNAQVVCAHDSRDATIGADHNVVIQTEPVPAAKSH